MTRKVVVLGGYGNFGAPIVRALAEGRDCEVLVAGRDRGRAVAFCASVNGDVTPLPIDSSAPDFATRLAAIDATVLIHTAGPFQSQGYDVARACIATGTHYIDLADGRTFVCGIDALHPEALARNVLVASGASTLPALSSAVVDSLAGEFSRIDGIDHGIAAGARPPGRATMEGVLAYAGRPFRQWRDGRWQTAWGWQGLGCHRYPSPAGTRWIARCDVPDLDLFPRRYPGVRSVTFRAGVAPAASMLSLWAASGLVRAGLLGSLTGAVPALHGMATAIARVGTRTSAMHVSVRGLDRDGANREITWTVVAENDHGPRIPCFPAIALARRILRGQIASRGAMPCMGLLGVDEILGVGAGLALRTSRRG